MSLSNKIKFDGETAVLDSNLDSKIKDERQKMNVFFNEIERQVNNIKLISNDLGEYHLGKIQGLRTAEYILEELTNQSQDAVKSTPQDGSKTTGSDKTLLDISNERQKLAKEIFDELDGNCYYSWDGTQIFSMKYSNYKELKQKYLGVKE